MKLKKMWKFLLSKDPNKKKITPHTIKNYFSAQWRIYFMTDKEFREEQVEWRRSLVQKKSPICLKKGICLCSCDMDEKLYETDGCEEEPACYPKWMSKKEWIIYKQENNF